MCRSLLFILGLAFAHSAHAQTERVYDYDEVQNRISASNQARFTATSAFSFRPRRAVLGALINIYGRNFDATNPAGHSVTFNGLPAPIQAVGPRVLTVAVPMGATSGAVVVTLPDQTMIPVGDLSVEGVRVTPEVVSIFNGQSVQFTSAITGSTNPSVEWAVNDIVGGNGAVGTISATGLYQAPRPNVELDFPLLVTARSLDLNVRGVAVLEPACSGSAPLVPGVPAAGTINFPTDRYCYSFDAAPGSKMVLAYTGTPSVRLRLRDSDGFLVEGTEDGTDLTIFPFVSLSGGSFVLNVEAAGSATGDFTVGLIEVNDPTLAYWINPGSGQWSDGANWLSGKVPNATQSARISLLAAGQSNWTAPTGGIHNLVCDENLTFQSGVFTLTGTATTSNTTTLTPNSDLVIGGSLLSSGTLHLQGGDITGTGIVRSTGDLVLSTPNPKTIGAGQTLINEGHGAWQDLGPLRLADGGVFRNLAGAVLDCEDGASVTNGVVGGEFQNEGTFRKSGGINTTQVGQLVTLMNEGLLESQSGTIRITGGGTNTGQIDAALGAQVDFATNPFTFGPGSVITGAGFTRVPNTGTVLVEANTTAENFEVGVNGTRAGSADLTVSSMLLWTGGTLMDTANTVTTGALELRGANTKMLAGGHTLRNVGTAMVFDAGRMRMSEGSRLVNATGAQFELQSNAPLDAIGTGGTIDNQGTFSKVGGTSASSIGNLLAFNNPGLVQAQQGILQIRGGGTADGVFDVTTGSLEFYSTPYTFLAGTAITGPGSTKLLGGSDLVVSGNSTAENLELGVNGARTGPADLTVTSNLILAGGSLSGPGRTIASGAMEWASPNIKDLQGGHTLINSGMAVLTGNAGLRLRDGSVFQNQGGAVLDLQSNSGFTNGATGGFVNNQGTIVKTQGTANSFSTLIALNNAGTLEAQVGTLLIAGGGINTGALHADAGAKIHFTAGTMQLGAGSTSSGTGEVGPITNGIVEVTANVTLGNFDIGPGGTLQGSPTLAVTGELDWAGGTMVGPGTTVNQGMGTFKGANPKIMTGGRILRNEGTVTWLDFGQLRLWQGSRFENMPGAVFDAQNSASVSGSAAPGVFDNAGTFRKSVNSGVTFFSSLNPFLNSGNVELFTGTLNCFGGFTQSAGLTTLAGGNLDASLVDIQGGILEGVGSVLDDVSNAGEVSPGAAGSVGTLSMTGTYSQAAAGMLTVQLAGVGNHDLLAVTQATTLNGILQVTLQGGFTPSVGDSFTILTASAITGTFATENLPSGFNWDVTYAGGAVVLTVLP